MDQDFPISMTPFHVRLLEETSHVRGLNMKIVLLRKDGHPSAKRALHTYLHSLPHPRCRDMRLLTVYRPLSAHHWRKRCPHDHVHSTGNFAHKAHVTEIFKDQAKEQARVDLLEPSYPSQREPCKPLHIALAHVWAPSSRSRICCHPAKVQSVGL